MPVAEESAPSTMPENKENTDIKSRDVIADKPVTKPSMPKSGHELEHRTEHNRDTLRKPLEYNQITNMAQREHV